MSFKVEPIPNAKFGVQVTNLDLSKDISQEDQNALKEIWTDVGLILFKGLGHNAEEHKRLSRVFGEPKPHEVRHLVQEEDNPEFMVLESRDFQKIGAYYHEDSPDKKFTGYIPWHADLIFTVQPNLGAMLRMIDIAEIDGQTAWLDTIYAYDTLDEETKKEIEGLEAEYQLILNHMEGRYCRDEKIHAAGEITGPDFDKFQPVAHPIVLTHPINGRKCLNISPLHLVRIVGMDDDKSDALLKKLVAHIINVEAKYTHDWEPNDMMLWDNWRTLHAALGYPVDVHRRAVRTQIYTEAVMGREIEETAAA